MSREGIGEGVRIESGKLKTVVLSPSGMKRFDNCPAGYIVSNMRDFLPKIDMSETKEITSVGRQLHALSESDFDPDFTDKVLFFEKESKKKQIQAMVQTAQSREYMSWPSATEMFLQVPVKDVGMIRGYPDRIARNVEEFDIIDLKSTGNIDPYGDRKQTLSYVYMLDKITKIMADYAGDRKPEDIDMDQAVKDLLPRLHVGEQTIRALAEVTGWRHIHPGNARMIIDYVRLDKPYTFKVSPYELAAYENYLVSTFSKVRRVVNDWLSHHKIERIEHHPGDCGICPIKGVCLAYQIIVNPHYDPLDPKDISTEEIVKELMDRTYAISINEERSKALKRALLERDKAGDATVKQYYNVVTQNSTSYPTSDVLMRIVPDMLKEPVKDIRFKDMVDWEVVYKTVAALVRTMTSESIGQDSIPEQFLDDVKDLKRVIPKKPYLKVKA